MTDFFPPEASKTYDGKNAALAPIAENMHFLIRLILKDLQPRAKILCVGAGTGAEILSLSKEYPGWSFVGVDPSAAMLEVGRERLESAGIINRCQLVHGYVHDLPAGENFDAALSILVGHFVKREEKLAFYRNMHQRLKPGGVFVNTEISFDLNAPEYPSMLENWARVQELMGASPESLKALPAALKDILSVLPPPEVEGLIRDAGIPLPVRFFQAFMIAGWYGRKALEATPQTNAPKPASTL